MARFDPVVITLTKDQPVELVELRIALQKQATQFSWWLIDMSEEETQQEMVKSWHDVKFLNAIAATGDPVDILNGTFKLIQEGLLMFIRPGHRLDPMLMQALIGFLRFNRDKMGAYVPIETAAGAHPSVPYIYGPDCFTFLPSECAMFRVDALKQMENPWANLSLVENFLREFKMWPALTGRTLVRSRPDDALIDSSPTADVGR